MEIREVVVNTVDEAKLEKFLKIKLGKNEGLDIERFAIYQNKFMISPDCCFGKLVRSHTDEGIIEVIDIECRIKKFNKEGGYSIRMDEPDFIKTIKLIDYLKISKKVLLTDFIRFNYNPRIEQNQNLLMSYIQKDEK